MKQSKLFSYNEPEFLEVFDLKDAKPLAQGIKNFVFPPCDKVDIVGSIRRQKTWIHDIYFVVVASDTGWKEIGEELKHRKAQTSCAGASVIKALLPYKNSFFQVDFYRAKPSTFGINQLIRTGSAEHSMWLAGYAISKGFRLEYNDGLLKDGVVVAGETEEGVFEALGLPCPKPEEREVVDGKPVWMRAMVYFCIHIGEEGREAEVPVDILIFCQATITC